MGVAAAWIYMAFDDIYTTEEQHKDPDNLPAFIERFGSRDLMLEDVPDAARACREWERKQRDGEGLEPEECP